VVSFTVPLMELICANVANEIKNENSVSARLLCP
jgi:hypothetical protein